METPGTEKRFGNTRVKLELTDITTLSVDAIVNAANSSLLGGGGVDGAIHRAGGPTVLAECKRIVAEIGKLEPGRAVMTTGGNLPAGRVIHTVGPIWRGGRQGETETLAACYRESLALADREKLHSLAFPSISTGAYGYPVAQAAEVALGAVKDYLESERSGLQSILFALFSPADLGAYRQALQKL